MKLNGEGEREEEENKIGGTEEEEEEEEEEGIGVKWAHHYSSIHRILLVGDGDFSFSLSLANAFGSASNIVATSLDSHDTMVKKYSKAESNLERLKEIGATVLHGVDATKMKFHADLKMQKFDRVIYNFPHAGFIGKEANTQVIKKLVDGFFKNASRMLRPYGEVHVSHKIGDPFQRWNLTELALRSSLILTGCVNFSIEDYPGYNNKRGDGHRSDRPFPLGECRTFKFRIGKNKKKKRAELVPNIICGRSFAETTASNPSMFEMFRGNHLALAGYSHEGWDRRNSRFDMGGVSCLVHHPPTIGIDKIYLEKPRSYVFDVRQASSIEDHWRNYRPYMIEAPQNPEIASWIEDPPRNYRPYMMEAPQNPEFASWIEDPMRNRPYMIEAPRSIYMIEAPRSTEIGYWNQLEGFHPRTDPRPRLPQDLPVKYDLEEETIMRHRMKTNRLFRSRLFG